MADPFISEIKIVPFSYAPRYWALCNGQILAISQNQALFSLLGTTFGGDGVRTFALPNLQDKVPIHVGKDYPLGRTDGKPTHTLSITEIPTHLHVASGTSASTDPNGTNIATSNLLASGPADIGKNYAPAGKLVAMGASAIANSGGSQPHNNMQPFLTLNFCIALSGIFPSRN